MKFLPALGIAALMTLGACAHIPTSINNPLSQSVAIKLVDAWGIAQSAAIGYLALPRCSATTPVLVGVPVCADHAVVAQIKAIDRVGSPAALKLAAVASNPANYPNLSLQTVYDTVQSALGALKQVEANGGIK